MTVVGAGCFYTVPAVSRFIEPLHTTIWFRAAFLAYVFAGLYCRCFTYTRATGRRRRGSRRPGCCTWWSVASPTVTSALLEALPRGPSFGNVFIIVYLYFLSQNLVRYRLLDLNELLGRMVVLGTLVFILAFIYGVLVGWVARTSRGCSSSTRCWHRPPSSS